MTECESFKPMKHFEIELIASCLQCSWLWAAIYIFNQLKAAWSVVGEGCLVLECVKRLSWLVFGRCSHLHCLCPCCREQRHIFTSNSFPAWPTNSVSFGLFDWSLLSVNVRLTELYIYEDSLICAVEITRDSRNNGNSSKNVTISS